MGESVYPGYPYTEDCQSNPPSSCANSSYQESPASMCSVNTDHTRLSPLSSSGFSTPMIHRSANDDINYHEGERELHQALQSRFPFLTGQRKRSRKLLTTEQTAVLESILEKTIYPSTPLREAIAHELGIPPRKVQIWFQNKRQSRRKSPYDTNASSTESCCNNNSTKPQSSRRTLDSADYQKLFTEVNSMSRNKHVLPLRQSDYQNGGYMSARPQALPPKSAHPSMGHLGAMPSRPPFRPRTRSELGSIQEARATVVAAVAAMRHDRAQHQDRQMHARVAASDRGREGAAITTTSSNLVSLNMAAQRYMNNASNNTSARPAAPAFWPLSKTTRVENPTSGSTVRPRPSPLSLDAHSLKNSANVVAINSSSSFDGHGRDDWTPNSATTCSSSAMTPTFPGDTLGRQHIEAGIRLFSPIKSTEKPANAPLQLAPLELTPGLNARHGNLPRIAELMRS